MSEKTTLPDQEQGNKTLNIDNNVNNVYKTFDVPDTIPGCYQEYKGEGDCIGCLYRLPCARASAGGYHE